MRKLVVAATLFLAACDAKRTGIGVPEPTTAAQSDTAFKAMDMRHGNVVGEDPMALEHQFVAQPDGGDIILERQIHEDMGINQIRAHLLLISRSFARGDFSLPGFVHEKPVPGTTVTSLSCCSVGQGAFNGTPVWASLGWTILLSIRNFSTSSPLTSVSIASLISTQGDRGCPLFVSISQRKAGF
jgi:hypothetical protein